MLTLSPAVPRINLAQAEAFVRKNFGRELKAAALHGEHDLNILLSGPQGPEAVMKVHHLGQDPAWLELEHRVLDHIASRSPEVVVPKVLTGLDGTALQILKTEAGSEHQVRLISFLPGQVYALARPHDRRLLRSLGSSLAKLDLAIVGFDDPALRRSYKWDLTQCLWIREHIASLLEGPRQSRVEAIAEEFVRRILPALPSLRRQVIYNDANDHNVLVDDGQVSGYVDFGDMVEAPLVCDLAIACAYALMGQVAPLDAACEVVSAYHSVNPLSDLELDLLWTLIQVRLAVSVTNSALQAVGRPENKYLSISEAPAWALLDRMASIHPRRAAYALRAACGLAVHPEGPAVEAWLQKRTAQFAAVTAVDPRREPCAVLDLSVGSLDLGNGEQWTIEDLQSLVDLKCRQAGAHLAIGRYLEPRLLYPFGTFQDQGLERPEPRTVHLGADLFLEAGTAVFAPLEGVVASLKHNAGVGDYGPTILLEHRAGEAGPAFFTLYGHLDAGCLETLSPGQRVTAGQPIARVGAPPVNGGWAPHLHFQILLDPLDGNGDFPGVARPTDRELFAGLCPDPNLILGVPGGLDARPEPTPELLDQRNRSLGPSLSVSYKKPLHIVRGWMQRLYDADGRVYLDMVNNVPHVGHSNPRVVEAAVRQLAVLNTNTRYLHPLIEAYAAELKATLPEPLSVCFFVNSGSEANELALRMARTVTGRKGTVVVAAGYHGNTSALIEISPYKHEGPGGSGAPPWVQKVALPDPYRGCFRGDDTGPRYAALVDAAMDLLEARGHAAGAFIAESMLGCGGQIVLPEGYLSESFRRIRAHGGLCIADEVQVGFGRAGTHFWAFQTQGVVPDIVTLGKPIGNGWPLGAVVTTPEIARAFANGMEYFNTFGGNPASIAVGRAVLQEILEKNLQANALRVGERILNGLRGLQDRHLVIGDVRGLGLYIGAELVKDRNTLEPHPAAADHVANRLKDFGVLISTDGPDHNVLKIKPPMVVDEADAETLLDALDRALAEDGAR